MNQNWIIVGTTFWKVVYLLSPNGHTHTHIHKYIYERGGWVGAKRTTRNRFNSWWRNNMLLKIILLLFGLETEPEARAQNIDWGYFRIRPTNIDASVPLSIINICISYDNLRICWSPQTVITRSYTHTSQTQALARCAGVARLKM